MFHLTLLMSFVLIINCLAPEVNAWCDVQQTGI